MASTIFERALRRVPEETHTFVSLSADILDRLHILMEEHGMTENDLAQQLGMSEAQLVAMLSIGHNFDLRRLAQLQTIFGEAIISAPNKHDPDMVIH